MRAAAGPGQAVVYRISGADLVDGGTPHDELLELAAALADGGAIDAINVGIGWHEARIPTVQLLVPHGAWRPWARAIRDAVGVPVIASNRINTLALADELLAAGDADFVSLARPFLADPQIVDQGPPTPGTPAARRQRVHRLRPGLHRPLDLRPARLVRGQPAGRLRARARARQRKCAGGRRRRRPGGDGGGSGAGRRRPPGQPVRGGRRAGRPVSDGEPDPRQGGLRAHRRLLRLRAGGARSRGPAGRGRPGRRGPGATTTASSSPPG